MTIDTPHPEAIASADRLIAQFRELHGVDPATRHNLIRAVGHIQRPAGMIPVSRAHLSALLESLDNWPGGMPADVEDVASTLCDALDE